MNPNDNPLLQDWDGPYGLPPFDRIRPEHFGPALDAGMADHLAELAALASSKDGPSFQNTIAAFDRSGASLARTAAVFGNLCSSRSDDALREVERAYKPKLALHETRVYLDPDLFARVEAVYAERLRSGLSTVQVRLVERIRLDFVRAGALLDEAAKKRVQDIWGALAAKYTAFGQAVLADEEEVFVPVADPAGLEGLPSDLVEAAAEAAKARGRPGEWAITVGRSFVEPFLTFAKDRELRRRVWEAFSARGETRPDRDTKPLMAEILSLRAELARIHGYASFADYALADRMAKSPAKVDALLRAVWGPAKARAAEEEKLFSDLAREADGIGRLEPWDWLFYADQVKRRDYSLDEAEVKPYFRVEAMVEAMFWAAGRLFGVDFVPVAGVPLYHPDVKLFEVRNRADGSLKGVFLSDNYARPGKRSGAWMNHFRKQSEGVVPIVVNNNNFTPGKPGEPVLISFDDASTLFHEFGHGLHGLLSDVPYRSLSGTSVLRDFVELPSQLFEHWVLAPELLGRFASHARTGEAIPPALVEKIRKARTFNMGWATLQYLGPAILDMELHSRTDFDGFDAAAYEREACARLGLPGVVGLRHRLPHFQHLFTGDGYSAGYYAYMWAEVLEADAYAAFEERGDPFDPELAARLKSRIYSAGDSVDPEEAFRAFRGRDPSIDALIRQRGLGG